MEPTPIPVRKQNAMKGVYSFQELYTSDTDSDRSMELKLEVPSFMTIEDDTYMTIKALVDDIFGDHRCYSCSRFLCCGGCLLHDINCWYLDFCASADLDKVRQIYTYRIDIFKGAMKDWEHYAYEVFDPETHLKINVGPHHIGFYVRCFTCKECKKQDNSTCHVNYHHHH